MKLKRIHSIILVLFLTVFMLFSGALPAKAAAALFDPSNFVLIHGGEFTMGSPETEKGRSTIETQHQVKVSDFYMGKYEVTFVEFNRFIAETGYQTDAEKEGSSNTCERNGWPYKRKGVNWRNGESGSVRSQIEENHPVVHVSWNDAVAYCKWLSNTTGKQFRLPTEAEWEYACRAGSGTAFNTGIDITVLQANFLNDQNWWRKGTVPVDSFAPNAWGLYNMHGNVSEWCSDWLGESYYGECIANGIVTNPTGPATGSRRVVRGGCYRHGSEACRSAFRNIRNPDYRGYDVGFRLVFVP